MKKLIRLMALITVFTFCIGTTVFASETPLYSMEGGDIDLDGDGDEDDESTGKDDENKDDESTNIEGDEDEESDSEESVAGGVASPQTNASIAPIVAMAGIAAAGAAAGLKRR